MFSRATRAALHIPAPASPQDALGRGKLMSLLSRNAGQGFAARPGAAELTCSVLGAESGIWLTPSWPARRNQLALAWGIWKMLSFWGRTATRSRQTCVSSLAGQLRITRKLFHPGRN